MAHFISPVSQSRILTGLSFPFRDVSCEKQGKDLSEPKVIDEPIYLNVEVSD